ncbi:hypothetical protein CJU94_17520 [Paraburkholderia aromaticivorans]|uniref:Uncharacterized protein n=2 Tax=Paraburkholderia aromaticivorans TaxID=2026199 RepID=A0A248VQ51_9BURK|nr:hypothetical protein CJU94_17520 [Paraburkholderia aromaticivorans]
MRSLTTRIAHFGAGFPAQWERLQIERPVSLAAALVVIAVSSMAFWWNQPDGLFDGGDPSRAAPSASASASLSAKPGGPDGPLFSHGLLSLEVFSAMTRTPTRPSSPLPVDDLRLGAPHAYLSCSPAARMGR